MRSEFPVDLPALVPRQQEQWVAEMRSSLSISSHTIINRHIPRDYEVIALTTLVIRHRDCIEIYIYIYKYIYCLWCYKMCCELFLRLTEISYGRTLDSRATMFGVCCICVTCIDIS